jgi:hypothetical protein
MQNNLSGTNALENKNPEDHNETVSTETEKKKTDNSATTPEILAQKAALADLLKKFPGLMV